MLRKEYFEWLCSKVIDDNSNVKYSKLMSCLYDSLFIPIMSMDENRTDDGKNLRYRFGRENNIPSSAISTYLDNNDARSSSMLEMMIALSIRCEETIMTDEEFGDRTGEWFWNMIVSLGLGTMNDLRFDEKYVNIVVDRFINRQYRRNGEGGLFTVDGIKKDMRKFEIWYQMCWYLDSL
jgi:hypothetical protein